MRAEIGVEAIVIIEKIERIEDMIGKRTWILEMLKGSMGQTHYARQHPNPELLIIQKKPDRKRKRGEVVNSELQRTNDAMLVGKEKAKMIYHDPVLRAEAEKEYQRLEAMCQKKGNRHVNGGKACGGYELPFHNLWAWIYGECLREAHQASRG